MESKEASCRRHVHEASDLSQQLYTLSQELAKDLRDCEQVLVPLSERCGPERAVVPAPGISIPDPAESSKRASLASGQTSPEINNPVRHDTARRVSFGNQQVLNFVDSDWTMADAETPLLQAGQEEEDDDRIDWGLTESQTSDIALSRVGTMNSQSDDLKNFGLSDSQTEDLRHRVQATSELEADLVGRRVLRSEGTISFGATNSDLFGRLGHSGRNISHVAASKKNHHIKRSTSRHRISLGGLKKRSIKDMNLDIQQIMCEMEYPLLQETPTLYLSACPDEFKLPDKELGDRECRHRLADMFGDDFVKDFKGAKKYSFVDANHSYCRVFFSDIIATRRAKLLASPNQQRRRLKADESAIRPTTQVKVSYTKPDAFDRRHTDLFLRSWSGVSIDDEDSLRVVHLREEMAPEREKYGDPSTISEIAKKLERSERFVLQWWKMDAEAVRDFLLLRKIWWRWRWPATRPSSMMRFVDAEKKKRKHVSAASETESHIIDWRVTYPCQESLREAWNAISAINEAMNEALSSPLCEVTYQPNAFTQSLVICNRTPGIPQVLFQKLKLWAPGKSKEDIVQDFEYALSDANLGKEDLTHNSMASKMWVDPEKGDQHWPHVQEKGDVYYDVDKWESPTQEYARLVTQNWWYGALFWALIYSNLAFMDLYSNVVYASTLFSHYAGQVDYRYNGDFRYNFLVSFFGLEAYIMASQWWVSEKDLSLQMRDAGDLVQGKTFTDKMLIRVASFFFFFVQVPTMVKDVVKTLHPFTNMQQKAAAKMYGARIFIITFPNEHMFRVTNAGAGMQEQFPPMLLSRFTLTLFKVYNAYMAESWASIFLCMTGVVLWPMQMRKFWKLMQDRLALRDYLKDRAKACGMTTQDMANPLEKEHKALAGIWKRFFPDVKGMDDYNRFRDATPKTFWTTFAFLILGNLCITGLQYAGVLNMSVGAQVVPGHGLQPQTLLTKAPWDSLEQGSDMREGVPVMSIDLDGDGIISPFELASLAGATSYDRPPAVRELALLLQRGLASTGAAGEPLPNWAKYLPMVEETAKALPNADTSKALPKVDEGTVVDEKQVEKEILMM